MKAKKPRPERTKRAQVVSHLRLLWLRSNERAAALKREGYCCENCGAKQSKAKGREVKVEVHHVNGIDWSGVADLVIERVLQPPELLEVLCKKCHDEEHRGG